MKKCPTCDKTFDDSMKFCQTDGTTLVDDAPAFDPYATIMAPPASIAVPDEKTAEEPVVEVASDPVIHETAGSQPIAPPEDILDIPEADPLKTMYVSESEMQAALGAVTPVAEEEFSDLPTVEEPPAPVVEIEEPPAPELEIVEATEPEPPSFIVPDAPASSFGDMSPPPSPFSPPPSPFEAASETPSPFDTPSESPAAAEVAVAQVFDSPEPDAPFNELETMHEPGFPSPFDTPQPPAAPVAEWTPPPAPDANWENQQIGANTPFQPPVAAGGPSSILAIVSLIVGVVALLTVVPTLIIPLCGIAPFAMGIAAIITGFLGRSRAKAQPENYSGSGFAMGGIITGVLSLLASIAIPLAYFLITFLFAGATSLQ